MTPEEKLAALKEMCERATEGPWTVAQANDADDYPIMERNGRRAVYLWLYSLDRGRDVAWCEVGPNALANSDFIAASRTILPDAIKAIEAVREMHKTVPALCIGWQAAPNVGVCRQCLCGSPCPTRRILDAFLEGVQI
jgi:hypothetical protein